MIIMNAPCIHARAGTVLCGGGCALNTARMYQWLCQVPYRTTVCGGVGADQGGQILQVLLNLPEGCLN